MERLKALLIEDDEDDFVLTRDLLGRSGRVSLDWACDYQSGIERLGRAEHDIYLLDYSLGERSGLELLREAIALGCKAPIIFLTGQSSYDVDVEAMRAGAADFLVKGQFDAPLLERAIRYALERKLSKEELQRAYGELEKRVQERTSELAAANEELRTEIQERLRAEDAARQIGEALQSANKKLSRWVVELEERNREINVLREMSDLLQTCSTMTDVGMVVAHSAGQLFPNDAGGICEISASRRVVEMIATWGEPPVRIGEGVYGPEDCWALRCCRPHVRSQGSGLLCPHLAADPPLASLCIPLMAYGEALGVLHLVSRAGGEKGIGPEKRQLAQTVTNSIALAVANLRLRETMRNQSIRDPLTGLYNRRYLEETLERELRRAARKGDPVAVLMADIDHFKSFNDRFGHDAGDAVLRALAEMLSRGTRRSDSVCRFGGEEFAVVMPETGQEAATKRAEELRLGAGRMAIQHAGNELGPLHLSIGVALFPRHGAEASQLIKAADVALYQAKSQGRDRVIIAEADAAADPAGSSGIAAIAEPDPPPSRETA